MHLYFLIVVSSPRFLATFPQAGRRCLCPCGCEGLENDRKHARKSCLKRKSEMKNSFLAISQLHSQCVHEEMLSHVATEERKEKEKEEREGVGRRKEEGISVLYEVV